MDSSLYSNLSTAIMNSRFGTEDDSMTSALMLCFLAQLSGNKTCAQPHEGRSETSDRMLIAATGALIAFGVYEISRTPQEAKSMQEEVSFLLYTRKNPEEFQKLIPYNPESICQSNFNISHPTKIIIHGFGGGGDTVSITLLRDAYLNGSDYNVISVDWGQLAAFPWYATAVDNVYKVGPVVSQFLDFLVTTLDLDPRDLHILGHSLGAHVSGIAASQMKTGTVGRITGLDPAYPYFSGTNSSRRLAEGDAEVVDVIHTTAGFLGFKDSIGKADFYPNAGMWPQPGCGADLIGMCSHSRAVKLYSDTIKNPKDLQAVRCSTWDLFLNHECSRNDGVYVGELLPKSALGDYFFSTTDHPPYGVM